MEIEWKVKNTGAEPFDFQAALHSYFTVSDIHNLYLHLILLLQYIDIKNASVVGLKGVNFINKVKGGERTSEERPAVVIGEEVDSVYLDVKQNPLLLVDKVLIISFT